MISPEPLESPLLHGLVAAVVYEHIELGTGGPQQDLTEAVHHDGPEMNREGIITSSGRDP